MKRLLPLYTLIFFAFLGSSLFLITLTSTLLNTQSLTLPPSFGFEKRSIFLGITLAAYPLGQLLGSAPLGALSDKVGRRYPMTLTLYATSLAYVLVALNFTHFSILFVSLGLFGAGLCAGNVTIANSALADTSEGEERTSRFSYATMVASLGFVIGPALSIFLNKIDNPAGPFWLLALCYLLFGIWMSLAFEETLPKEKRMIEPISKIFHQSIQVMHDIKLRSIFILNLITYIGVFGFCRLYPQYLVNQFGIDQTTLCFSIINLDLPIIIATLLILQPLFRKLTLKTLYRRSALSYSVGIVLLLIAPTLGWTWPLIYPVAISHAIILPVTTALVSQHASASTQGSALGTNTSLLVLSQLTAAIIGMGLTQFHIKLPLITVGVALAIAYLSINKLSRNLQKE